MSQSSFGEALLRLWPNGDRAVPGLRAGMVASAPAVFQQYGIATPLLAAHVMSAFRRELDGGQLEPSPRRVPATLGCDP